MSFPAGPLWHLVNETSVQASLEGVSKSWAAGNFDALLGGLETPQLDTVAIAAALRRDAPMSFLVRATDFDVVPPPELLNIRVRTRGPWPSDLRLLRIRGLVVRW